MATVTNTITLPGGVTPSRVDVVIELVASTTTPAAGWVTATDVTILATYRPTVIGGEWAADLTPNAEITPAGTVYKITEYADHRRYINYITVVAGGGTVYSLLTDEPTSLSSAVADRTNWALTSEELTLPWGKGTIPITYPAASATVQHYYVDFATGSNGNAGTSGAPVKHIETAIGLVTTDTGVIFTKAPSSVPYRRILLASTTKTIWLCPWPGDADWHFYGSTQLTSGWTVSSGSIYRNTVSLSSPGCCVVTDLADADGLPTRLSRNTSTPTTPSEGQYGYTGGVLYAYLPGGVNPGSYVVEAGNWDYAINVRGGGTFYILDAAFRYCGSNGVKNGGTSDGANLRTIRCHFAYNGQNGLNTSNQAIQTVMFQCKAYGNGVRHGQLGDGFNLHAETGWDTDVIAVDCEASFNSDEGISPHEAVRLYVTGGRFHDNAYSGFAGVDTSESWFSGTLFDGNHRSGVSTTEATIGVYGEAIVHLDDVQIVGGNAMPILVDTDATLYATRVRSYGGSGTTSPALEV